MNTFAMNPALRPAVETSPGRGLPDAAETFDSGGNPFDAVLGALKGPSSQLRTVATDAAVPQDPAAAGVSLPDPADPLGRLAASAPVEPTRMTGQDAFAALVARAVPERPSGRAGNGVTGVAAPAPGPIVAAASADRPSIGRSEGDRDPLGADLQGADDSGPVRPDPALRADLVVAAPILPSPDPARGASQPTPATAASPLTSATPAMPPQAAPEARMRATVLRQETHFAPVMPRSVRPPDGDAAAAGSLPADEPAAAVPTGPVTVPSVLLPVRGVPAGTPPAATQVPGGTQSRSPESLADAPVRRAPMTTDVGAGTEAASRNVFAPPDAVSASPSATPEAGSWIPAAGERTAPVAPAAARPEVVGAIAASDASPTDRWTAVSATVDTETAGRSQPSEDRDTPDRAKASSSGSAGSALPPASVAPVVAARAAVARNAAPPAPGLPAADPQASAAGTTATAAAPATIPVAPVRTGEPVHTPAIDPGPAPHPALGTVSAKGELAPGERDGVAESQHESVAPKGATAGVSPVPASAPPTSLASATGAGSLASPAAQIAEAVATEAQRVASAQPGAPTNQVVADGPLRILTLQLRPLDLGNVVVRLRLRGSQLEMSLHASREDTAELLRKDGALLSALLRDAGYQPDAVTIGAPMPEAAPGNAPTSGQSFQPGSGGQNPARDMSDQPARRPDETGTERTTETSERTHETHSGSPDRSGVYL